jgi:hypothetical protein
MQRSGRGSRKGAASKFVGRGRNTHAHLYYTAVYLTLDVVGGATPATPRYNCWVRRTEPDAKGNKISVAHLETIITIHRDSPGSESGRLSN